MLNLDDASLDVHPGGCFWKVEILRLVFKGEVGWSVCRESTETLTHQILLINWAVFVVYLHLNPLGVFVLDSVRWTQLRDGCQSTEEVKWIQSILTCTS